MGVFSCPPDDRDGHTFEVCLYNITPCSSSPIWPLLAFFDEASAVEWEQKLRKFARTLDPENSHNYYDKAVNGDSRLATWLTDQGFERFNHVWWSLKETK